jgi:hypothetical protein
VTEPGNNDHATASSINEVPFVHIMSEASAEMKHSFAKGMAAFSHNLTKGEVAEEIVRRFLRERLPSSIEIAKGQIIDSRGQLSKQLDVIIYDAGHTPILYTSDEKDNRLVPSEGVLAVIEVKSHVDPSNVPGIIANMTSVKSLDKSAYYPTAGLTNVINMYGHTYYHFPTLYFLFAYDVGNFAAVALAFGALLSQLDVDKRIDCGCVLNKGVLVNQAPSGIIDGIPGPDTTMRGYPTENALLLFYLLITRFLFQAQMRPVELRRYMPDDFAI